MRKKTLLVLLMVLFTVFLMSCQSKSGVSNTDTDTGTHISKVKFSNAKGFSKVNPDYFTVYEDEESLEVFEGVIASAVKVSGIVDIAAPEYSFEVIYSDENKQSYHLWVGESGKKSTLMKVENTHTIYTVPAPLTDKLIDLIK